MAQLTTRPNIQLADGVTCAVAAAQAWPTAKKIAHIHPDYSYGRNAVGKWLRRMPCCAQALRLNPTVRDPIPYYMLMLDKVLIQFPSTLLSVACAK
jgi:hypothetical protein